MKSALSSVVAVLVAAELGRARSYACPADNDKTMVTGGKKYKLKCGSGILGMPIEQKPCGNLADCAARCAANAQCVHSTLVDGECALKKAGNEFQLAELATWIFVEKATDGQTTTPPPSGQQQQQQKPLTGGQQASYACPGDDRKRYTTNAVPYELRCNTGHSTTHWKTEPCPSLKECADRCAREPECYSCDHDRTSNTCAFKKAPAVTTPWAAGDAWFPVACPDARATRAVEEPEVASTLTCPTNDGKIWEGSDGTWFYLQCCTDAGAATVVDQGSAGSHTECVEKCVKNKECKSVAYDSAHATDNCRLYGNAAFSTVAADRVHHAFVTDPPTNKANLTTSRRCSTECPYADGQLYQSVTGENFLMSCKKRFGTTYLKIDRRDSYESCLAACDVMPECRSVEYEPRTSKCFYGTNAQQPRLAAAAFVSAHSLGCAGACSACKSKACDRLANEPLPADSARCDADHGKLLVAGGDQLRLNCRHCWYSAPDTIRTDAAVKTLADCARRCGEDPYCHGANWMGPAVGCKMHPGRDKNGNAPTLKTSAECDSLTPLTRSLAAYRDEDIGDSGVTTREW